MSQWFGAQWTGCNAVRELTHLGRKPFTLTFPINLSLDWTMSGRCFTFFPSWRQDKSFWHHNGFLRLGYSNWAGWHFKSTTKDFLGFFPHSSRSFPFILHSSEQPLLFYFSFLNPSITKCQILSRWVSTTNSSSVVIVTEAMRKCCCWIKTRRLTVTVWLLKHQKLCFYFRLPVVSDYLALSFKMAFKYQPVFELWVVISQND